MPKRLKLTKNPFFRSTKLAKTGISLLAKELGGKLSPETSLQTRIKQAKEIVDTLDQLKGGAMKVGQLLSIEFSDLLPDEVTNILFKLQDDSVFLDTSEIHSIIKSELGEEIFHKISDFSDTPIAAASIGQVHTAVIDGKKVAIKIQFPGVKNTIDSDIASAGRIIKTLLKILGKNIHIDPILEEIRLSLKDETDYEREARAMSLYYETFSHDKRFKIPRPFPEFSSDKILTMEYCDGQKITNWLKVCNLSDMQKFCLNIIDLVVMEFFDFGLIQTDPNFGNFLYNASTKEIVLLDFGAVRSYRGEYRKQIIEFVNCALKGDFEAVLNLSYTLGFIDARESTAIKDLYFSMIEAIIGIFRPENQPFNFSNKQRIGEIRSSAIAFASNVKYSSPARNIIFVNRKIGGIFNLLREADFSHDITEYIASLNHPDRTFTEIEFN